MDEKLNIVREEHTDYIRLKVSGRIDGYWSGQLGEYFDSLLRAGDYCVSLDLNGVNYMSSLGIRILVKYAKEFRQVNGRFGISEVSAGVEEVLKMAGLNKVLQWESVTSPHPVEKSEKIIESEGYSFGISRGKASQAMTCFLAGDPGKIRAGGYAANDCRHVDFGKQHYGIGLGAIGSGYEDCQTRFGEFVALGDAVVYSPSGKSSSTDYMLRSGNLVPGIEMAYGILFQGVFNDVIRFSSRDTANSIKFSKLLENIFAITGYTSFVMMMLAETTGLVGISLNQSPSESGATDLFSFPGIRENINFTSEPEYRDMMTVTAGLACRDGNDDSKAFTRPSATGSGIQQHFHTAVFHYHPIKNNDIDLDETVASLFELEKVRGVLHLVHDTRDFSGVGESEFKSGICWIGKVDTFTKL